MQERQLISYRSEYDANVAAHAVVDAAVDKKANDVTLIEVGKATTLADFFVLATGSSERQVNAISNGIQERMREQPDVFLLHQEGVAADGWVLLDYGQIIVHVFAPEQREYYDLEQRWSDAPTLLKIQ